MAGWRRSLSSATRLVVIRLRNSWDGVIHPWNVNGRDIPCNLRVGTHPPWACFLFVSFPYSPVGVARAAHERSLFTKPHGGGGEPLQSYRLRESKQNHSPCRSLTIEPGPRGCRKTKGTPSRAFPAPATTLSVGGTSLPCPSRHKRCAGNTRGQEHSGMHFEHRDLPRRRKTSIRQLVISSTSWLDQNRSGKARRETVEGSEGTRRVKPAVRSWTKFSKARRALRSTQRLERTRRLAASGRLQGSTPRDPPSGYPLRDFVGVRCCPLAHEGSR